MNAVYPILIIAAVVCFFWLMAWLVMLVSQLQQQRRATQARLETDRRVFNQFVHKLATVHEIQDALHIVAAQIREDIDAESIGIFIPDTSTLAEDNATPLLRGASCTGYFPVFTGDIAALEQTKVFENHRFRLEYFRGEVIQPDVGILGGVYRDRRGKLLDGALLNRGDYAFTGKIYTMMVLPLMLEDDFVGVICAVNRMRNFVAFNDGDLQLFTQLSATVALTNRLIGIYSEREKQTRIQHELEFCADFQKAILPVVPPAIGELRIAALNRSCNEVSGDFYDYLPLDDHRVMLMVADATGKGIPACMLTSMSRSFVRSLAERYTSLRAFVEDLNRLIYANSDETHYLTAAILVIDTQTYRCEFACAGHPAMIAQPPNRSCHDIKPDGQALGMWPNEFLAFDTVEFELEKNMRLCLFTDGINEALNAQGDEYGFARLKACYQAQRQGVSPKSVIAAILADVQAFAGSEPQSDDQTLLVVSREGDS